MLLQDETEKRKRFEERALQAGQEVEEKTVDLQHAQNGLKRVEEELSAANEEVEELVRRLEATRIETRQQEGVIEELTRRNEDLEMVRKVN